MTARFARWLGVATLIGLALTAWIGGWVGFALGWLASLFGVYALAQVVAALSQLAHPRAPGLNPNQFIRISTLGMLKLPTWFGAAWASNQLGPREIQAFVVGTVVVYCATVGWGDSGVEESDIR